MAVQESDIVAYCAANMPESDSVPVGGAIDTTTKALFTDISSAGTVEALSSAAGDTTQIVTVTGRDSTGAIVSENLNLNGTNVVAGSQSFARILKIVVNNSHTGTITVRKASDDVTIATLESGVLAVRRLFYDATAEASGGSTRNFYEKVFIRNNNSTSALLNATIAESADPTTFITFALESGFNGNNSGTGRLNAVPNGMVAGSFTNNTKNLPSPSSLGPTSGIGVWLKLSVPAGSTPTGSTYTLEVNGKTA